LTRKRAVLVGGKREQKRGKFQWEAFPFNGKTKFEEKRLHTHGHGVKKKPLEREKRKSPLQSRGILEVVLGFGGPRAEGSGVTKKGGEVKRRQPSEDEVNRAAETTPDQADEKYR